MRAVFLSCSERKVRDGAPLPAIDRYDGPCFRVLRAYLRQSATEGPQVWITSAKYGLVAGKDPIHNYNRRMTPRRAHRLAGDILCQFRRLWHEGPFDQAFVSLSENYALAMRDCWPTLPQSVSVTFARGSIGRRCSLLKAWLGGRDGKADEYANIGTPYHAHTLLGIPITVTREQALAVAEERLEAERSKAGAFQTWYVDVAGYRVAAKWLVSKLTGLSVSRFRTNDALRALRSIGIECLSSSPSECTMRKGTDDD